MRRISDILYRDGLGLDLCIPDTAHFPLFIYFHGGGLENGDKRCPFLDGLIEHGIAYASVDYRIYPEACYPDFLYDAADAVAFLKEHIGEYGKCDGMYIGGSSAGGIFQ